MEKKCPDCAETVLAEARKCRFCGHDFRSEAIADGDASTAPLGKARKAPTGKEKAQGCAVMLVLMAVAGGLLAWCGGDRDPTQLSSACRPQAEVLVTQAIKDALRDPKSFEEIATIYGPVDQVGEHKMRMEFRARNGFGGMNNNVATAQVNHDSCKVTQFIVAR